MSLTSWSLEIIHTTLVDHICYVGYPVTANRSRVTSQLLVVLTLTAIAKMDARDLLMM